MRCPPSLHVAESAASGRSSISQLKKPPNPGVITAPLPVPLATIVGVDVYPEPSASIVADTIGPVEFSVRVMSTCLPLAPVLASERACSVV